MGLMWSSSASWARSASENPSQAQEVTGTRVSPCRWSALGLPACAQAQRGKVEDLWFSALRACLGAAWAQLLGLLQKQSAKSRMLLPLGSSGRSPIQSFMFLFQVLFSCSWIYFSAVLARELIRRRGCKPQFLPPPGKGMTQIFRLASFLPSFPEGVLGWNLSVAALAIEDTVSRMFRSQFNSVCI